MTDSAEENVHSLEEAIFIVLKKALIHDGVVAGLHQVAKALEASKVSDSKKVRVCFLAKSVTENEYTSLVKALCLENSIPLVEVEDAMSLGQAAGLYRTDKDGQPRKIVGAGCVAVLDYGEESSALDTLKAHIESN